MSATSSLSAAELGHQIFSMCLKSVVALMGETAADKQSAPKIVGHGPEPLSQKELLIAALWNLYHAYRARLPDAFATAHSDYLRFLEVEPDATAREHAILTERYAEYDAAFSPDYGPVPAAVYAHALRTWPQGVDIIMLMRIRSWLAIDLIGFRDVLAAFDFPLEEPKAIDRASTAVELVLELLATSERVGPAHFTHEEGRSQSFCLHGIEVPTPDEEAMASEAWGASNLLPRDTGRQRFFRLVRLGEDLMLGVYLLAHMNQVTARAELRAALLRALPTEITAHLPEATIAPYLDHCEQYGLQLAGGDQRAA